MKECYLNYPFGDCDNCKDITTRIECIQGSTGYCGCKRKLSENEYERTCELCGAIVCDECSDIDEHGESCCKTCSEKYVDGNGYDLIHGDCLEEMKLISDNSVDMILCDLPYGTMACKWDEIIPFNELWKQYNRIIKDDGVIILFGHQPFTTDLINSNRDMFRHINYWNKENCGSFTVCKYRPMPIIEDIVVFAKDKVYYNPQMIMANKDNIRPRNKTNKVKSDTTQPISSGEYKVSSYHNEKLRYPKNLLTYNSRKGELNSKKRLHPTQKPVDLCEWLIMSYSKECAVVLDNCMGSGSTGVACLNTNRRFIGIEKDKKYFNIAKERLENLA